MRVEIVYSPSNNVKEAYVQLTKQLEQIDFEPNFILFFLTKSVWKNYRIFTELFRKKFPKTKMLGCTVEGYLVRDEIWMRGVAALLGKFNGKVEVFWAKDKIASKTAEKLGEKIGKKWDAILLTFPAFYFPGKFDFLKAFINDKRYYRKFNKSKNTKEKEEILKDYSKFLESKFVFPINKTLKILAEKTGKETPIIGMNLVPLEAAAYTPIILANYEDIGRGAAAMCFKGKVNVIFHDVFPERGKNYEETFEVIKSYFPRTEKVRVIKAGTTIGEINGLKPIEFLKMKRSGFEDISQNEFLNRIEGEKLLMASPYHIGFISQKTHGSIFLGLLSYPINLYPSLFNLDELYDTTAFCGEFFREGVKSFGEVFDMKKFNGFDFFIIDQNSIMSFGGDIYKLIDIIKEKSSYYFGIFSSFPSSYLPTPKKRYFSEIDNGICVNLTGTSVILEFFI